MHEVRFTLDDDDYKAVRLAAAGRLVSVAVFCRAALAVAVETGRVDEATMVGRGLAAGVRDGLPAVVKAAGIVTGIATESDGPPIRADGDVVVEPDVRIVTHAGRGYRLSEANGVRGCKHATLKPDGGLRMKCRTCGSKFLPV